ncbi:Proton-gated ion channel [Alphaproteobacteria bacterium SO-S41]|nr:Proton-gated ion channel [Alphaproteobacteria bacterium SO-S41]
MRRTLSVLALVWLALTAFALPAAAQIGLPADKGLPVVVRIGTTFVELQSFDQDAGTFTATVDVRVIWEDLRLRMTPDHALDPPLIYRGTDATDRLQGLWTPPIELINQVGDAAHTEIALRTYPDGRAELMQRTTATFSTPFDVTRFPFDRQKLQVEIATRLEPASNVVLQTRQDDLDFSRAASGAELEGWTLGLVDMRSVPLPGWYGASHSRIVASLAITRNPANLIAAMFIPLFASLLIPMLTIWLNRIEDGVFQIETFELVNLIIGGLFAVIALNFTVNADYAVLSAGDNSVSQLFALNYVTLGICLLVNILFYRYRVFETTLGRYGQEQLFLVLAWAIPVIVLTAAVAIVAVALV